MAVDPQKTLDWLAVIGEIVGGMVAFFTATWASLKYVLVTKSYGHKVFATKEATEAVYLRKHTDTINGVEYKGADTMYAPVQDMATIKQLHEEAIDESRKWRELAKDWMQRP